MKNYEVLYCQMMAEIKSGNIFQLASQYGNDYLKKEFDRPVFPSGKALENLSQFHEDLPKQISSNAITIIEQLEKYGAPATVAKNGGRYFGFVNGSIIPVSVAAKNMASFWDQNASMQIMSPVASTLEEVVEKWLKDLLRLPQNVVAGFLSGSSAANLTSLYAARYRLLQNQNWDVHKKGLRNSPPYRIITGKHTHSTILKSINLIGFGTDNIEWVDVDDQGRISIDNIPRLDDKTLLILQAGNVNSGAFDDFSLICQKAREAGAWVHIDGAFGLWAGATQKFAHLMRGAEFAHSWTLDAHKTLNTPYDSGIILCSDAEALRSALGMSAGYIIKGEHRDGMDFTLEMSRRARVVELWATLKYLGYEGIEMLIAHFHDRAHQFANEIKNIDGIKIMNDVVFNQVLLQCESDEMTNAVIKEIQEMRTCWVGGSTWFGKRVIRVSLCSWATTQDDISKSVASFKLALGRCKKNH